MTTYNQTIEDYGPNGLIRTRTITFDLTGEAELTYLGPDKVRQSYATLRQWAIDAQANYDSWPTKSNAQKDAAQRETIRRLGVFMDRLADLLLLEGRS